MISAEIETAELQALARELAAAGVKTAALSAARLGEVARETQADMKSLAPKRTGELADSIELRGGRDYRRIVATAGHATFVEFGTSDTAPQPYANPAAARAEAKLLAAFLDVGDPFA